LCFPPPETFTIPEIPEDLKMSYGAPFFEKPYIGGSVNFDFNDKSKIVTCEFELVEPLSVVEKVIATAMDTRKLQLFPGSQFNPSIQHGARLFDSYQAKTSKLLAEYKNKPTLTFPDNQGSSVESPEEKAEKESFEKVFQQPSAQVGEIVYLGENSDFNLVELEGTEKPPYEVIYTAKAAFAVIESNGQKEVNLGFEFFTDIPRAAFELDNPPNSIDNWVRYTKMDQDGNLSEPSSAVVCSQGATQPITVKTYLYNEFANGFNKQATQQSDANQQFRSREQEFPDMYGIHDHEEFAQISCLAALQVNPDDNSIYGTYWMQSGTTFSMEDGTEYVMAISDWYAELKNDKVEPPKKEFQVQGSLKYKKKGDPIEYSATLGYEVTQDLETDNTLAMVFNFKSTQADKLNPESQSVTQFLRYRKKGDFSQYRYVMCTAKGDSEFHVDNFQPYLGDLSAIDSLSTRSENAAGNTATFWDSKLADVVSAHGHFFEKSNDKGANYARVKDGVAEAQCIAKLKIPKFNDGSESFVGDDILGDYDVQIGLNI